MPIPPCPKPEARAFLQSLDVEQIYLNAEFDRCYCQRCYNGPKTISNEGPTPYVVPEPGWVRFGLHVDRRAQAMDVFNKWCACFHGVKSTLVLKSILDCGGLVKPGSTLLDGTVLASAKCAGRTDEVVYVTPHHPLRFFVISRTLMGCTDPPLLRESAHPISVRSSRQPATLR